MLEALNPELIKDENARRAVMLLMNLVEELKQENIRLREENQRLRDENNRLKGEQGKPEVKAGKKRKSTDHSSEKERKQKEEWSKGKRKERVKIDREEVVQVDQEQLPEDAEFKGYEDTVVQDLKIGTDNILFRKEKYYSEGEGKTYIASLPKGYEGAFGPTVRSLVISFYYAAGMTEPKIVELLGEMGIGISAGKVSNLLTKGLGTWQEEADALLKAGLTSSGWQHIDDTATRVNGENQHCHVVGNSYYSWYDTREKKDRLTVIAVLQNKERPDYLYNDGTGAWLELFNVPKWVEEEVKKWPQDELLRQEAVEGVMAERLAKRLNQQQQARVLEAGALTAYHAQQEIPVVPILLSDDAGQFDKIAGEHALCWVHEGRHYKKLTPALAYHRKLLKSFIQEFWGYYHELAAYQKSPSPREAERLERRFDELFSKEIGYAELDKRIAKTKRKKQELLVVLKHPEVPLHNNPAELAVRQRVRKRDISFGPRTEDGRRSWDLFASLSETAKKLGVSFYQYVYDRISGTHQMPALADLVLAKNVPVAASPTVD